MRFNEADVERFRTTPENGHTILLTEPNPGQKTFADYPNIRGCIIKIQDMFDRYRLSINLGTEDYNMNDLNRWMDDFFKIELMIFDHEISRYKRVNREDLKRIFEDEIKKLDSSDEDEEISTGAEHAVPANTTAAFANVAAAGATSVTNVARPKPTTVAISIAKAGLDERSHPHINLDDDDDDQMDQPDYDDDEWL